MKRRDTLSAAVTLGALALPIAAMAQAAGKVRRIGVLMGYAEDDSEAQSRLAIFRKTLAGLGWNEGRNLRIETRWSAGDVVRASALARELVALQPDVILGSTTPVTAALQKETSTIPIVFTVVSDPVGSGLVKSLSHPGGNITGFINLESTLAEKWLQVLKEIAPRVTRAAVMYNPVTATSAEYYMRPLANAASKLGVTLVPSIVHSDADIEAAIATLSRQPNTGLIALVDSFMVVHRKSAIASTARHRLPAVYFATYFVAEGGLISYGVDVVDLFRRAAPYVDQILRGASTANLPVQQPTKFELAINRTAANALGLTIPQSLRIRADEVVE
ncbi:MAG: ABC transporter substrate-binding protein [Burkholderiaceae bacterium]